MLVKFHHLPRDPGENKRYLKPPPRLRFPSSVLGKHTTYSPNGGLIVMNILNMVMNPVVASETSP